MKKKSLSLKLVIYFSVFVLIIVVGITTYAYVESAEVLEGQVKKDLTAIAEATEGQVYMFNRVKKTLTSDWASDWLVRTLIEKVVNNQATPDDLEQLRSHLKSKMSVHPSVELIDILDKNMRVMFSLEEGRAGHDESEHLEGRNVEEFLNFKFGDTFIGKTTVIEHEEFHPEKPVFHTLAPIMGKNNSMLGFILIHISSEELNKIMAGTAQLEEGAISGQKFILEQKTAEMYLVNFEKIMITPSRFIDNSVLKQKVDAEPVKKCLENREEFSGSYVNYLGKHVYGASMCFPESEIVLLVEIEEEEIFAPLRKERNDIIMAGFFAFIASIFLGLLIARLFLKDLMKIVVAAKEVIRGNFNIRAKVESGDELQDLAASFNEMLDGIEESKNKLKEAHSELEDANKGLEGKVKERTSELEKLKDDLEQIVDDKTFELQKKIGELEKFKELTIGRELKMMSLKQEINDLKGKNKTLNIKKGK